MRLVHVSRAAAVEVAAATVAAAEAATVAAAAVAVVVAAVAVAVATEVTAAAIDAIVATATRKLGVCQSDELGGQADCLSFFLWGLPVSLSGCGCRFGAAGLSFGLWGSATADRNRRNTVAGCPDRSGSPFQLR